MDDTLYTTTTFGMRGYFAVLISTRDGFPEPVNTGYGSYKTKAEAVREAKDWAKADGIPYKD